MVGFLTGLAVLSGVAYWLYRAKQADVAACVEALGFSTAGERITRRGQTAEGPAFWEQRMASGALAGCEAEVWERQIRRAVDAKYRKSRGSMQTLLVLRPPRPPAHAFRLQPVGIMGWIERASAGGSAPVPTGDAALDEAFHLYTNRGPEALAVLNAHLRRDLLDFRRAMAGGEAKTPPARLAASLRMGSFEIGPDRVAFGVFGTLSRKTGEHLRLAAPLLAKMCESESSGP